MRDIVDDPQRQLQFFVRTDQNLGRAVGRAIGVRVSTLMAAGITEGRVFRRIKRSGEIGASLSVDAVSSIYSELPPWSVQEEWGRRLNGQE